MADRHAVIIVHTAVQATAALRAAAICQKAAVLQSAPDAIHYAGSLYLLHVFKQACDAVPDARATCILDCGDAAALAISAIMDGHRAVRLNAAPLSQAKLADIARQQGVALYSGYPPSLDLKRQHDPEAACARWLESYAKD